MEIADAHFLLARLGSGAAPGEAERLRAQGLERWLDAQLHPPVEDEPCRRWLADARLHIKYGAKEGAWAACDEMRPLRTLSQPIEQSWGLLDRDHVDNAERRRVLLEVIAARLGRAVVTDYPLRELLVGFWHDHFHVEAWSQDQVAVALAAYDRDAIRAHALGNFRAMLEAVATSAAMLYYLSNRSSRAGAANENYGRELFELHTLGRDAYLNDRYDRWRAVPGALQGKPAGYIDQDVYEAARALTGWTVEDGTGIENGRSLPRTGKFAYVERWHDGYQKRVLATEFDAFRPAMADGRQVLDLVANHPATAQHLATKLVRRLVGEPVPPALVAKAAAEWQRAAKAPDQIARVVRVIALGGVLESPRDARIRRPSAAVVAFQRAAGIVPVPSEALINELAGAGERLFGYGAPTGLPDRAGPFLGADALRRRWGLLQAVAENRLGTGLADPLAQGLPPASGLRDALTWWLERLGAGGTVEAQAIVEGLAQPPDAPVGPVNAPDLGRRMAHLGGLAALAPGFLVG